MPAEDAPWPFVLPALQAPANQRELGKMSLNRKQDSALKQINFYKEFTTNLTNQHELIQHILLMFVRLVWFVVKIIKKC